jgi:nucleotide-binding universal stress UspA family protein
MPGILVGVDGSDHSRHALAWAIHEAVQRHVPLTVMTVRPDPPHPATQIYWNVPSLSEKSHDLERARTAVRRFADEVAKEIGETVPELVVDATTGDPAQELVKASRDADMLVVGSRGSGVFAELLMGSVSSKVAHHAACPIVIIPGTCQTAQRGGRQGRGERH